MRFAITEQAVRQSMQEACASPPAPTMGQGGGLRLAGRQLRSPHPGLPKGLAEADLFLLGLLLIVHPHWGGRCSHVAPLLPVSFHLT